MEDKKLLIVGIDPGITTAYAILDIDGKLIHLSSSKQLDLSLLISETIKLGKVILVGTDKVKTPRLVELFATKLGAKIVNPKSDLKVDEKRRIVSNFNFDNDHQGDALASALFAYVETKILLDKIDLFAEKNNKHAIKNKIKELVVTKSMSIRNVVSLIEKKDEEDKITERVIVEKKLSEMDFLKLYSKIKKYEAEIRLIKIYNDNLRKSLDSFEKNMTRPKPLKDYKKLTDFRENRIISLENKIKSKEKELDQIKSLVKKFNSIILNINNFCILKKLDTLGMNEFNFKNKILNIRVNDILLVDNPNTVSNYVIDMLKNKVFIIVYKEPISKKFESVFPFIFINAQNLKIDENKYFGFVEKKHFDMEKNKVDWFKKIIDDYKKEKQLISR